MLLLPGIRGGGELAGVAAEQVVHAVPARSGGLDQVRAGQHVERPAGLRYGRAGEGRGGVGLDVGAGVQAQ